MEKCGVLLGSSLIKCYSIFGSNNCDQVKGTIYYTRKCPKGYKRKGLSCSYECTSHGLIDKGEFCEKPEDELDLPCPKGTIRKGKTCLKPFPRFFPFIMNPFNNKL